MMWRKPLPRLACVLASALTWCGTLIAFRTLVTDSTQYVFLVWNLGLATLPLLASNLLRHCKGTLTRAVLAPIWLLFLPNAPYIVTDLLHLRTLDSGPMWLDVLLVASCAGTGLAMGYVSVLQVQRLFTQCGRPRLGLAVSVGALFLSAFGMYLGRFQRWHSIDALINPVALLPDIVGPFTDPLLHSRAWEITLGYGISLSLGYAFLAALQSATPPPEHPEPRSEMGPGTPSKEEERSHP